MKVKRQRDAHTQNRQRGHTQEQECGFLKEGDVLKHKVWAPPGRVTFNCSCITVYTFDESQVAKKHHFLFDQKDD